MNVYRFADRQQLGSLMCSGLIPARILQTPASYVVSQDYITVASEGQLQPQEVHQLKQLDLLVNDVPDHSQVSEVRHWAELLPPQGMKLDYASVSVVLFRLHDGESLVSWCNELLHLGCDRQSICQVHWQAREISLLRVVKPPLYIILKAMESNRRVDLYVPATEGQELLWLPIGYQHPVLSCVQIQLHNLILVNAQGIWEYLPVPQWTDLYQTLDVDLKFINTGVESKKPQPIRVPLRMINQQRDSQAQLWLVKKDAQQTVEDLFAQLTDEEINRLNFMVLKRQDGQDWVVLKLRSRVQKPLTLTLDAIACSPYGPLDNLFLPTDQGIEPRIRPETLQQSFVPDKNKLVIWLAEEGGAVEVLELDYDNFTLLQDWLEYIVHEERDTLQTWIRQCQFDFTGVKTFDAEWSEVKTKKGEKREKNIKVKEQSQLKETIVETENKPVKSPTKKTRGIFSWTRQESPLEEDEQQQILAQLERQFIELDTPANDPQRDKLWLQLARQYSLMKKDKEAALCWSRLIWQNRQSEYMQEWRNSVLQWHNEDDLLNFILTQEIPDECQVRSLVALVISGDYAERQRAKITNWCDQHDQLLDVRSLWLLRWRLCEDSGRDVLQLVGTRDRILARLTNGLSLEKDVPAFMRFCGSKQGDSLTVFRLQGELEKLYQFFCNSSSKPSALEAPRELTRAYVEFGFAWGFARLNHSQRAKELFNGAQEMLDTHDMVHGLLSRLYHCRLQQALTGQARETALDSEVEKLLHDLDRFDRYKVDRLRQVSHILEPQQRLDAIQGFQEELKDSRGPEFQELTGIGDKGQLTQAIDRLLRRALEEEKDESQSLRLLDGVMDFFPKIGEAEAIPRLEKIIRQLSKFSHAHQGILLEDTLILAGFYSRQDLIAQQLVAMEQLLNKMTNEELLQIAHTLAKLMTSLRRVGLFDQGMQILSQAYERLHTLPDSLIARLGLAVGFIEMNQMDRFQDLHNEALAFLDDESHALPRRLEVNHLLCQACSHLKVDWALQRFTEIIQRLGMITDSYNTNSHFCLSVIQFMESLVLGVASDQLVLGDTGSKWLGEDELLVRQLIQQDLQDMQKAKAHYE